MFQGLVRINASGLAALTLASPSRHHWAWGDGWADVSGLFLNHSLFAGPYGRALRNKQVIFRQRHEKHYAYEILFRLFNM
jgi:hypothetical protein